MKTTFFSHKNYLHAKDKATMKTPELTCGCVGGRGMGEQALRSRVCSGLRELSAELLKSMKTTFFSHKNYLHAQPKSKVG